MFWWNLTKIGQIYIPYEFAQSGSIPPKIKWETEADEGSQTTHATPGVYLASWNRKPIGQRDLLASTKMDQDFPGKVTHCRHVYFLSRSHRRALKRTTQYWAKLLKVKENPRQKWKNCKLCWGARQWVDIQLSKLRFEVIVFYQGWYLHEEEEPRF